MSQQSPLAELLGHQMQVEHLERMFQGKTIPHAMLFCGPPGIGKRSAANAFAAKLLSSPGEKPTGHATASASEMLKLFAAGNHPDFHFVAPEEGKRDITVESIRELCGQLHMRPYYARCSVAVINDAHLMSISASNAMLMTLEEPPPESYLILVTHAPHRLPETILSRCQPINFGRLSTNDITAVLQRVLANAGASPNLAAPMAAICDGSLAPLQLDAYIDAKTSKVIDAEALKDHLNGLGAEVDRITKRLETLSESTSQFSKSGALALIAAAELSAKDQLSEIFWHTMRGFIRSRLLQATGNNTRHWADIFRDALKTEQLVKERNLNPQIQLSRFMLELADA